MNFLRYLGPGLLVTVGFIDPGNWASNIAAGSGYGYELLWMVTLSTIMLIFCSTMRRISHCHGKVPLGGGEPLSACVAENTILATAMMQRWRPQWRRSSAVRLRSRCCSAFRSSSAA